MKNLKLLFVIVLLSVLSAESYSQNKVRFSEISNLTYQLDCVSNQGIPCSKRNLSQLWKKEFLQTEKDSTMIKEWGELRKFNSKYINLSNQEGNRRASLSLFQKIRIAGLQANGISDYLTRLDLLTPPQERAGFEKVVRHFYPKFKVWWDKEVAQKGETFRLETKKVLDSPKVSRQINNFVNFYSPSLTSDYDTSFNLLYVPVTIKEATNGQQIENYSLVEFKFNEKPEDRIDVVIHELCHFYFGNISRENRNKLSKSFSAVNSPLSIPAFNLLNESLATAFGNGMIARGLMTKERYEKYSSRKMSFYNNDAIDRTAKATIPMLDEFLSNKKTIQSSDFARRYIAEVEKAFSKDELSPRLYLFTMSLIIDGELEKFSIRSVARAIGSTSIFNGQGSWSEKPIIEDLKRTEKRNSVIIIKPKNLKALTKNGILNKSEVKTIRKKYKKEKVALFNKQRKNYINAYIIVANDKKTADNAIKFLGMTKQFIGLNRDFKAKS